MKTIKLVINESVLDAVIIREANPRLAICQDRVISLTNNDQSIIAGFDLLNLFESNGGYTFNAAPLAINAGSPYLQKQQPVTNPEPIRNEGLNNFLGQLKQNVAKERGANAVVIFYRIMPDKRIEEISRTLPMPFGEALDIYANTPNPASQLIDFDDMEDLRIKLQQHAEDIKNPEWLEDLFNQM